MKLSHEGLLRSEDWKKSVRGFPFFINRAARGRRPANGAHGAPYILETRFAVFLL
jgi:hypothetical protein